VNLHLRAGADAIDTGKSLATSFTADIDGYPRPRGAAWDIGADETAFTAVTTYYRSIGTLAALVDPGPITVTAGSPLVTKSGGPGWRAQKRGRGDVLIVGTDKYMIAGVSSDDVLTLATLPAVPYSGGYTIARQFSTFEAWEDCIDGQAAPPPAAPCFHFPAPTSSLVNDDRREVGIAYNDTAFTPAAQVLFKDAITDTAHTITLTADPGNRHNGAPGTGVVIDGLGANKGFRIEDSNYTVEWLEFKNVYGVNDESNILVRTNTSLTGVLLQNLLIHDFADGTNEMHGIGLQGDGAKTLTIRNVMMWNGDYKGIEGDEATDTVTIENCTVTGMANYGIDAFHSQFIVRNSISVGNPSGDYVMLAVSPLGTLTGSHNTSTSAFGPQVSFTSSSTGVAAATILVNPSANLHLKPGGNRRWARASTSRRAS
jgi:hypothetical protein